MKARCICINQRARWRVDDGKNEFWALRRLCHCTLFIFSQCLLQVGIPRSQSQCMQRTCQCHASVCDDAKLMTALFVSYIRVLANLCPEDSFADPNPSFWKQMWSSDLRTFGNFRRFFNMRMDLPRQALKISIGSIQICVAIEAMTIKLPSILSS